MIPVSAKRLRHRPCQLRDGRVQSVQLFPLFDRQGHVHRVMVLPPDPGVICLAPCKPGQWRVPMWGTILFDGNRNAWQDLARHPAPDLSDLWHYDPWWVLTEEAYARHPVRAPLKETNCPDHLAVKIHTLYYRRDLSRISLAFSTKKGTTHWRRWSEDWLPRFRAGDEVSVTRPKGPTAGSPWVLDPIWAPRQKPGQT